VSPRLDGRLVPVARLGVLRERMFALLREHFEGVTREAFARDLAGKDWVIVLEDEERALQGFSTLAFYGTEFRGEALNVACSGDTIVRRGAWGSPALAREWIGAVDDLRARHPARRTLWLLLASGFRTYRFLPVFWREFHPRIDLETPAEARALLDHLASERYGELYDKRSGLVRFPEPQILGQELRGLLPERLRDPHVAFFLACNPRHECGDELVCLADLCDENLTARGQRVLDSARRRGARRREKRA
jgi:hypothetical protein